MVAQRGIRCRVLQCNVSHARTEVQVVVLGDRHAAAAREYVVHGAGVGGGWQVGVRTPPAASVTDSLGDVHCAVVAPDPGQSSKNAARRQGSRSAGAGGQRHGRDRGGGVGAGKRR